MSSRIWLAVIPVALGALSACGGSGSSEPLPGPVAGDERLKLASDALELEAAIKSGLTTQVTATPPQTNAAADGGFTGTYTQEPNVDEFDAVRYDGEFLYIAPRRYLGCCFILDSEADTSISTGNPPESSIRILRSDPETASAAVVSTIPLEDGVSIQGMYTAGDRLFALTSTAFVGTFGEAWAAPAVWAPEALGFQVYDLSDRAVPSKLADVVIEGLFVDSRRIGDTVYIISRFAPAIDGIIFAPQTAEEVAQNEAILANLGLEDLTPTITVDGVTRPLVDSGNCYIGNDEDLVDYPVITNITAVSLTNPTQFTNTCLNDEVYGVYVSESALYFPRVLTGTTPDVQATRIHKLALVGQGAVYRGSIDVAGNVWRGGQADFRMNEFEGDLRVMSTEFVEDDLDRFEHRLFVIRESDQAVALDIVGQLPNAARPQPIGKPNELLYGVRFVGERAYAVTFEFIDPLYTIDLSNGEDPRILGELTVTGFSDFLHPVNDALLLGLGRAEDGGIKVELFDVADVSRPLSRGAVTIGDRGSFSEALYNRHAFTYQPDVAGVDRFLMPVEASGLDTADGSFGSRLNLFEIHDKETPALASLVQRGTMAPPVSTAEPWAFEHRSFIDGDTVYWVRDREVWSALWQTPELVNGPF